MQPAWNCCGTAASSLQPPRCNSLVERYSGNPLALKLVADTVRDLFGSNVDAFLGGETPVFDDIRNVLDEQFGRLSELEREIVTWLAVERNRRRPKSCGSDLARPPGDGIFLEVMRSLQRNSLVEAAVYDGAGNVPTAGLAERRHGIRDRSSGTHPVRGTRERSVSLAASACPGQGAQPGVRAGEPTPPAAATHRSLVGRSLGPSRRGWSPAATC